MFLRFCEWSAGGGGGSLATSVASASGPTLDDPLGARLIPRQQVRRQMVYDSFQAPVHSFLPKSHSRYHSFELGTMASPASSIRCFFRKSLPLPLPSSLPTGFAGAPPCRLELGAIPWVSTGWMPTAAKRWSADGRERRTWRADRRESERERERELTRLLSIPIREANKTKI